MNPRLVRLYEQELQHLREVGAEFAQAFPKVATRLGMKATEVSDPYVERLLEGVAFMAARVQLKLEAEFPRFTQRLLDIVYPSYLAPTPAMLVVRFEPDLGDSNLAKGSTLPQGSGFTSSQLGKGEKTRCEFRTAHEVTFWPLQLVDAQYFSSAADLPLGALGLGDRVKSGARLRLRTTAAGVKFSNLALDRLCFFLGGSGNDTTAYKLHELCLSRCVGVLVRPAGEGAAWHELLRPECVRPVGYRDSEALLPATLRTFQGYRLLQEYFAFPYRFLFVEIAELAASVRRHAGEELEIVLLFDREETALEGRVGASSFSLFCTPAINLFPRNMDPVHLSDKTPSYHVVADRARPMDFEIFEVTGVTGLGSGKGVQPFYPFYAAFHAEHIDQSAFFTVQRELRLLSGTQKRTGDRTAYVGSEVYISLVDTNEVPYSSDLRQLAVTGLCTNRDLTLQLPVNVRDTDFKLDTAAPVKAMRCVKGPSAPRSALGEAALAWRFISQLGLNYLSLLGTEKTQAAQVLREMLQLYAPSDDNAARKQIDGLRSVHTERCVRRLPLAGPLAYGRGIEIELEVDELAFAGGSAFLFGSVMEQFFARHVSINSFTETVLRSSARGEIMRWVPRCGARPIL